MASRAHERAQKILGNPTEHQLAQLIMHDISAQSANAEGRPTSQALMLDAMLMIVIFIEDTGHVDVGVLAYARKPVHREKPSERFLLGTIRSIAFGMVLPVEVM